MNIIELAIAILAGICLIGIIVLAALNIAIPVVLTTVGSALVGWLIGKKNEQIVGLFKQKK